MLAGRMQVLTKWLPLTSTAARLRVAYEMKAERWQNDTSFKIVIRAEMDDAETGTQMTDLGNWKWFRKYEWKTIYGEPRQTSPRKRSKLWS